MRITAPVFQKFLDNLESKNPKAVEVAAKLLAVETYAQDDLSFLKDKKIGPVYLKALKQNPSLETQKALLGGMINMSLKDVGLRYNLYSTKGLKDELMKCLSKGSPLSSMAGAAIANIIPFPSLAKPVDDCKIPALLPPVKSPIGSKNFKGEKNETVQLRLPLQNNLECLHQFSEFIHDSDFYDQVTPFVIKDLIHFVTHESGKIREEAFFCIQRLTLGSEKAAEHILRAPGFIEILNDILCHQNHSEIKLALTAIFNLTHDNPKVVKLFSEKKWLEIFEKYLTSSSEDIQHAAFAVICDIIKDNPLLIEKFLSSSTFMQLFSQAFAEKPSIIFSHGIRALISRPETRILFFQLKDLPSILSALLSKDSHFGASIVSKLSSDKKYLHAFGKKRDLIKNMISLLKSDNKDSDLYTLSFLLKISKHKPSCGQLRKVKVLTGDLLANAFARGDDNIKLLVLFILLYIFENQHTVINQLKQSTKLSDLIAKVALLSGSEIQNAAATVLKKVFASRIDTSGKIRLIKVNI